MSKRTTRSHGVRLPTELWDAIDAEADALAMSRNELVRRRMERVVSRAQESQKTVGSRRDLADGDLVALPEA